MAEDGEMNDDHELVELLREIRSYMRFTTAWTFVTAAALVLVLLGVVTFEVRPL